MASGLYPLAVGAPLAGDLAYDTGTFYVMLLGDGYTANFDTHDYRNDLTNEITGTGYTAGGQSCTVTLGSYNTSTNKYLITLGAGGTTWSTATITARYAAYYHRRGGASSADELIGLDDFGSNVTATAADFTVNASTFEIELNAA